MTRSVACSGHFAPVGDPRRPSAAGDRRHWAAPPGRPRAVPVPSRRRAALHGAVPVASVPPLGRAHATPSPRCRSSRTPPRVLAAPWFGPARPRPPRPAFRWRGPGSLARFPVPPERGSPLPAPPRLGGRSSRSARRAHSERDAAARVHRSGRASAAVTGSSARCGGDGPASPQRGTTHQRPPRPLHDVLGVGGRGPGRTGRSPRHDTDSAGGEEDHRQPLPHGPRRSTPGCRWIRACVGTTARGAGRVVSRVRRHRCVAGGRRRGWP